MLKYDLAGQRFGRLMAIEHVHADGKPKWRCVCDCGVEKLVMGADLRRGMVMSCGCLMKASTAARSRTHGLSRTAEYRAYHEMMARCSNASRKDYAHYGGRGIRVCDRWLSDFKNFVDDMGTKPSPSHTLDRVDVNGNYEPGNCRWATRAEQSRNTRATVLSDQIASNIKRMLGNGESVIRIANRLGLNKSTVGNIKYTGAWQ